jgi:hypothetical protein
MFFTFSIGVSVAFCVLRTPYHISNLLILFLVKVIDGILILKQFALGVDI